MTDHSIIVFLSIELASALVQSIMVHLHFELSILIHSDTDSEFALQFPLFSLVILELIIELPVETHGSVGFNTSIGRVISDISDLRSGSQFHSEVSSLSSHFLSVLDEVIQHIGSSNRVFAEIILSLDLVIAHFQISV